jgi:hypothetical protein
MKEKINIEKLFQDSLNQLDVNAPHDAWANIEKQLDKKRKKRILPPFWWKVGGIAAALVLGYFLGKNDVFDDNKNSIVIENNNVLDKNSLPDGKENGKNNSEINKNINSVTSESENEVVINDSKNNTSESYKNSNNTSNSNKSLQNGIRKNNSDLKNPFSNSQKNISNQGVAQNNTNNSKVEEVEKNNQNKNSIYTKFQPLEEITFQEKNKTAFDNTVKLSDKLTDRNSDNSISGITNNKIQNSTINRNQPIVAKNENIKKLDSTSIASVEPNALEELLNEKEKKSDLNAEPKLNRWQVSTNVAPIYFSSLADGSPIDAKLESNQKSYNTSLSVGVGVQYAVNKKLKLRTGINNLSLDYNTNDIRFTQTAEAKTLQNVDANLAGKLLEVKTIAEIPKGPTLVDEGNELKVFNGSINQKLGYFEVPMELSYSVLNQKLGIEVLGGFSTMFLSQNEVNIVSSGLDMSIGEANNLNSVHFSGNLGLGIKYGIWKKLEARIEPVFKYQFNTFSNNDGNFRPYVFGVYSGFSYTF